MVHLGAFGVVGGSFWTRLHLNFLGACHTMAKCTALWQGVNACWVQARHRWGSTLRWWLAK